jgi:uncharacterized protein YndB with AHSA1/START domain
MNDLILNTSIIFEADAAEVWKGLTDPAIVKQYFFGTNLKSDWKIGSPITFSGEWEGKAYEDKGTVLEIDPGKFLKYSYWSSMSGTLDKPENYNNITYRLTEDNGKTTLHLTQEGVKNEDALDHSEQNWQSVFKGLKDILEKHELTK